MYLLTIVDLTARCAEEQTCVEGPFQTAKEARDALSKMAELGEIVVEGATWHGDKYWFNPDDPVCVATIHNLLEDVRLGIISDDTLIPAEYGPVVKGDDGALYLSIVVAEDRCVSYSEIEKSGQ